MKLFLSSFKSKKGNTINVLKLVTVVNPNTYETKTQTLFITDDQLQDIQKNGIVVEKC